MQAAYEHLAPTTDGSFRVVVRREDSFPFAWHLHPEYELTLITAGSGRRFVGDSVRPYGPGDLVLVGALVPHTWQSMSSGPSEAVVVHFRGDFLGSGLWQAPELGPVSALLERANRGVAFDGGTGRLVKDLAATDDPARRIIRLLDVLATAAVDPNATQLASTGFSPPRRDDSRKRIDDVCNYLVEHYAEPISLQEVADVAHLTPAAFCRFFRRTTGRSLTDYLTDLRMGAVRRMLIETDEPIAAVASTCGFHNLAHFNRTFRRLNGETPREFRGAHTRPAYAGPTT